MPKEKMKKIKISVHFLQLIVNYYFLEPFFSLGFGLSDLGLGFDFGLSDFGFGLDFDFSGI